MSDKEEGYQIDSEFPKPGKRVSNIVGTCERDLEGWVCYFEAGR